MAQINFTEAGSTAGNGLVTVGLFPIVNKITYIKMRANKQKRNAVFRNNSFTGILSLTIAFFCIAQTRNIKLTRVYAPVIA